MKHTPAASERYNVRFSPVSVELDERPARWRIGVLVLTTDHTTERDFARICRDLDVAVYVARVPFSNPVNEVSLRAMQPLLGEAAASILPGESMDALAYSCTAASVAIGDHAIAETLHKAKPGVQVVTPISGAVAAFQALGAGTISVLAPYDAQVTATLGKYFESQGLRVSKLTCLGLADDREIARISPATLVEAAVEADEAGADALFLSCTALRAAQVVERIEDRVGKPVVTSNQAMCWRALRVAGCTATLIGHGRLFELGSDVAGGSAR